MTTPRNRRYSVSGHIPSPSVARPPNRRMSIGGGGPPKPTTSRPPRKSMIPRVGRENHSPQHSVSSNRTGHKSVGGSRRQSISGRQSVAPTKPTVPDNRPINDKSHQQACIKKLLGFLQSRGYEYPVTFRSLTRPSSKDFTNICTFMLRYFDADFGKGNLKFEDEVALNFKFLGYPFNISKTALVAAGSPHTWPTLLAALTWLMDTIQKVDSHVPSNELENTTPFENLSDLDSKSEKAFYQYVGLSYVAYMKGEEEVGNKLLDNLYLRFEQDNENINQAKERVTDINASILEQIKEVSDRVEDLSVLVQKRDGYKTDLEQFHDLIYQMDEHKSSLQRKVEECTAQLASKNQKLDKITTCINELTQQIQDQEFNITDIHKLDSELKGLSEATDRVYEQRDAHETNLKTLQQELLVATNALSELVDAYNVKLSQTESNFPKMEFSPDNLLDNFVVGVDVQDIQNSVKALLEQCTETVESSKQDYQDALDALTRSDDGFREAQAKQQIVLDKIAQFDSTMRSEQKAHEAMLEIREREVALVEEKIASLRDPVALEEQMAAYERQCAELEALRIEHSEKNIQLRKSVVQEIQQACEKMAQHDRFFVEQLEAVQQHWEDVQGLIDNM